jgi:hypothetical protein
MSSANTINIKNPIEVRKAGIDALLKALGPVGMAVFLKQFELGEGNYTKEKQEIISGFTEEDIEQLIKE